MRRDSLGGMRLGWVGFCLVVLGSTATARALDDTSPTLRWGALGGVSASLPIGDVRAPNASRDEFVSALWVDLEPLQFDVGDHLNLAAVARFVVAGGVDGKAIEAGLDPSRRRTAEGKRLDAPEVSAIELGVKARYFPWGDAAFRPYVGLQISYGTLGAVYASTSATPAMGAGRPAAPALEAHRHQGVGAKLVLGVRWDVSLRAFNTTVRAPIAVELSYTHNTWLKLRRDRQVELDDGQLIGEGPLVDYVGASVLVGFLR